MYENASKNINALIVAIIDADNAIPTAGVLTSFFTTSVNAPAPNNSPRENVIANKNMFVLI